MNYHSLFPLMSIRCILRFIEVDVDRNGVMLSFDEIAEMNEEPRRKRTGYQNLETIDLQLIALG